MSAQTKQRVIGIIVLLFLAFILLPWLFSSNKSLPLGISNTSTNQTTPNSKTVLPASHVVDQPEMTNPSERSDQESQSNQTDNYVPPKIKPGPVNLKIVDMEEPADSPQNANADKIKEIQHKMMAISEEQPVAAKKVSAPATKKTSIKLKVAAVQKPKPASLKLPELSLESTAKTDNDSKLWAVQLGCFSNQTNADSLLKQLRAKGYQAYLHISKTSTGSVTRVFVGPEKEREDAEQLMSKIEKSLHVHGVIVKAH